MYQMDYIAHKWDKYSLQREQIKELSIYILVNGVNAGISMWSERTA